MLEVQVRLKCNVGMSIRTAHLYLPLFVFVNYNPKSQNLTLTNMNLI
jgi:hypothetical protein